MKDKINSIRGDWLTTLLLVIATVIILFLFIRFTNNKAETFGVAPERPEIASVVGKDENSPVVVAYMDPLCPRCKEYFDDTLVNVKKEYADTGKLRLEIRLLSIISSESAPLVQFAMCGHDQGAFWESLALVYKQLYRNNGKAPVQNARSFFEDYSYSELAKSVSIDSKKLESCIAENKYEAKLRKSNFQAKEDGVVSTPNTFIRGTEPLRGYVTFNQIKPLLKYVK